MRELFPQKYKILSNSIFYWAYWDGGFSMETSSLWWILSRNARMRVCTVRDSYMSQGVALGYIMGWPCRP